MAGNFGLGPGVFSFLRQKRSLTQGRFSYCFLPWDTAHKSPVFLRFWLPGFNSNISSLRESGVPESTIVTLVMRQPQFLVLATEKLAAHVDRAVVMGFDVSKSVFVHAIHVFVCLNESTLRRKMEVYTRCGWSESEVVTAFLRRPICMILSEEKITATLDFLVDKLGYEPAAIAQCPVILDLSLEKRIKPRCLVAGILNDKGLKKMNSGTMFLLLSEELFLKRYVVKYEKDIPGLLDIYRGL
ncbi:hypothetical protein CASFOL_008912 [Castilleja foliolosa]|uniref:Mitochondrial transcription termination factor family protein n=1 Tax=Castilleja foliolosa TaxID=1961234 RepID=A0ABD3E4E3_9LAMI